MAAKERELPASFAAGMNTFNKIILPDRDLFSHYEGEHIAIMGQSVMDFDDDPHQLSLRVGANFPDLVLYIPHVVRLNPDHPISNDPEIADYLTESEVYYQQHLRTDVTWLRTHLNAQVAIIGRQVVGEDYSEDQLWTRVWGIYGMVPIFMTKVTEEYPQIMPVSLHMATHSDLSKLADH